MSESTALPDVRDDRARSRFVVEQDGVVSELVYRDEPGRLVLLHTEVPDEVGGRGIGGALVRAALARARSDGLVVVPWCPFARRWLTKHPDESATIGIDWSAPPARR